MKDIILKKLRLLTEGDMQQQPPQGQQQPVQKPVLEKAPADSGDKPTRGGGEEADDSLQEEVRKALANPFLNGVEVMVHVWKGSDRDDATDRSLWGKKAEGKPQPHGGNYKFDKEECVNILNVIHKAGKSMLMKRKESH